MKYQQWIKHCTLLETYLSSNQKRDFPMLIISHRVQGYVSTMKLQRENIFFKLTIYILIIFKILQNCKIHKQKRQIFIAVRTKDGARGQ